LKRYSTFAIVAVIALAVFGNGSLAQLPTSTAPCDPLIDGTYCATQGGRLRDQTTAPANMGSIQSLSGDLSLGQTSIATFGGISVSGNNTVCIGLLRRGSCN
jgi:hypothetical protein